MRAPAVAAERAPRPKLHAALSLAIGAAVVLYPFVVYFGQSRLGARSMAVLLIALFALRLVLARAGARPLLRTTGIGAAALVPICAGAIALALVSLLSGSANAVLYYPVLVNAVLLALFASSLAFPPTIVERIARARTPALPAEARGYLRGVTIAWCLFFVANGAAALYTATQSSFETWALYNGFVAYVLIGAMFAAEWLVRGRVMRAPRR